MKFPYTPKCGSIKKFLEKIPSVGIPDKVTTRFLYTLGFKSTNDRALITVFKALKFLDESGAPTDYYKQYRDKSKSRRVIGIAIKETYEELFKLYPNAAEKDHATLRNYFSTQSGLSEGTSQSMVETFKALSSMADFSNGVIDLADPVMKHNLEASLPRATNQIVERAFGDERKVRITLPFDIKPEEIETLKKLLDNYK